MRIRSMLRPAAGLFLAFIALGRPSAQTHPITVHANQRVVFLQMTPTEYADWKTKNEFGVKAKREGLIKDLYLKFTDAFDFIFLVLNEIEVPEDIDYTGQLISVSNKTTGIGSSAFDFSASYGSAGRLKSVMALTQKDYVQMGPSLHELMHTWGNHGIVTSAFDPFGPGMGAIDDFQPHWGFTGGSVPGQLGGFKQSTLVENVDGNPKRYRTESFGQFANGGNSFPYSDLERYLMGMIPLSEVAPFDVFRNVTEYDYQTDEFVADTKVRYDAARIESELGVRNPASATAQKDFRLLIVVLGDTPPTTADWNLFDKDSENFGKPASDGIPAIQNFWEATGGKGTMETGKLNETLKSAAIFSFGPRRAHLAAGLLPGTAFDLAGRRVGGYGTNTLRVVVDPDMRKAAR